MSLDNQLSRLRARAIRALGENRVTDAVAKVKAIIGPGIIPDSEKLAQSAMNKLHDGEVPSAEELSALEIVVRLLRPVVLTRNCELEDLPDSAGENLYSPQLRVMWNAFRGVVQPLVCSIGRIELKNGAHVGTGFLVADGLMATNRHVLGALTWGAEELVEGAARVVFKEEYQQTNAKKDIAAIKSVAAIHPRLDIVLLEVDKQGRPAVEIDPTPVVEGAQVAVIGYPAEDKSNNPLFLAGVFKGIYGKKRASLGEVLNSVHSPAFFHDCSTTQGNSGSPVFSIETGKVTGIHRAGYFMYRNEAIDAEALHSFVTDNIE